MIQGIRYTNPNLNSLIEQIQTARQTHDFIKLKAIKQKRKMHHSFSLANQRKKQFENRPFFKHNTKQGQYLDKTLKSIPYKFIPKYKNQTFIMPNRVFEKGRAGRRFFIKMKDSSIYSFKDPQDQQIIQAINKQQKQKTIISRKIQQYARIIDIEDGQKRAKQNSQFLRTRKIFNYTKPSSEIFNDQEPLLQPKQNQYVLKKKASLSKTFNYSNKWRPTSKGSDMFSSTVSKSVFSQRRHAISVF